MHALNTKEKCMSLHENKFPTLRNMHALFLFELHYGVLEFSKNFSLDRCIHECVFCT